MPLLDVAPPHPCHRAPPCQPIYRLLCPCRRTQDFDEVAVQEGEEAAMAAEGMLLFGTLPMVAFGDLKLVERT